MQAEHDHDEHAERVPPPGHERGAASQHECGCSARSTRRPRPEIARSSRASERVRCTAGSRRRARCRAGARRSERTGRAPPPAEGYRLHETWRPNFPRAGVSRLPPALVASRPVVEINGLTKRYGDVLARRRRVLVVPAGSVTGFLGPNGAGKTTTLKLLLGLADADRGRGADRRPPVRALAPARLVGAVLESGDFHPRRTGRDHLRALPRPPVSSTRGRRGSRNRRAGGRRARREYSLGMRQRLGLAGALLGEPRLARPRRARQRPRPHRHPLAARLPADLRRAGRRRARLQPRARRARADRRTAS